MNGNHTATQPMPRKYHNRVLNKDVTALLAQLPDNCVNIILGDPDYGVGINYGGYHYTTRQLEYDRWYRELAIAAYRTLKPSGNMFLINYPSRNQRLWVSLDAVAHSVTEYCWIYNTNVGHAKRRLTTAHRSILHVTKSARNHFHPGLEAEERLSWTYHNLVKNVSRQKTQHPCQIPEALTSKLIAAATHPGDTALILFGGSGSEVLAAKQRGLIWVTCELNPEYCDLIRKRVRNATV